MGIRNKQSRNSILDNSLHASGSGWFHPLAVTHTLRIFRVAQDSRNAKYDGLDGSPDDHWRSGFEVYLTETPSHITVTVRIPDL